jgi:hypothetical protein
MKDQFDIERNKLMDFTVYAASLCGWTAGLYTVVVPSSKLDFWVTTGKAFVWASSACLGAGIPLIVTRGIIRSVRNRGQNPPEL